MTNIAARRIILSHFGRFRRTPYAQHRSVTLYSYGLAIAQPPTSSNRRPMERRPIAKRGLLCHSFRHHCPDGSPELEDEFHGDGSGIAAARGGAVKVIVGNSDGPSHENC